MDNENANKKVGKKLSQVIQRRKKKKNIEELQKDLSAFDEVRNILQQSDELFKRPLLSQRLPSPVLEINEIPSNAPGLNLFCSSRAFSIFSEESLKLSKFIDPSETFFGRPLSGLTDRIFRKLLVSLVYELRGTENDKNRCISFYVLHLLSATPDKELIVASFEFLKRFPCLLTAADILPIICNFGVDSTDICDSVVEIPDYLRSDEVRRTDFPTLNIKRIFEILIIFFEQDQILCDNSAKPLVIALTKLTLDNRLRYSSILPSACCLLTGIAFKCEETVGTDVVAPWLLLEGQHCLNQLDVCRISLRPTSTTLLQSLVRLTINTTLNSSLKLKVPFRIKELKIVLRHCNKEGKQAFSLLQLFTTFELLTASLPMISATFGDIQSISKELANLDGLLLNVKDSSDLVRLRAVIVKLRSLVTLKSGARFTPMMKEL